MTIFYKKILQYPKTYLLLLLFVCFASYGDIRLWDGGGFIIPFVIFALSVVVFLHVYLSLLATSIEKLQRIKQAAFEESVRLAMKINPPAPPKKRGRAKKTPEPPPTQMFSAPPLKPVKNRLTRIYLLSSLALMTLPAFALLSTQSFFFQSLAFPIFPLGLLIFTNLRLSSKFSLSQGQMFALTAKNLFLAAGVSFLIPLACLSLAVTWF